MLIVKPGGRIILVNHLYSEQGIAAKFERWIARHARPLGLRPEFPFARLAAWVLRADAEGLGWRLDLPGETIGPANGSLHRDACMKALALFGRSDATP